MPLKFVQVPSIIMRDIEKGKLIPNDMLTYTYLIKATNRAGGKFLLKTEPEMAEEIIVNEKPISTSKVTKSLRRLRDAGHIQREYSSRSSKTTILTKV
jgi:predicted transcriptional regulator